MKRIKPFDDGFLTCCFTGYRPSKFPFSLDKCDPDYIKFENRLTDAVFSLADEGVYTFYSGMAMGFDIIAAETVLLLRQAYKKATVRLICAVPFPEQMQSYDSKWSERYKNIINQADEAVLISDKYYQGCYMRRNKFMVDKSDVVVTWYDGLAGGTRNTLCYAEKSGVRIINLCENAINDYSCNDIYRIVDDIED